MHMNALHSMPQKWPLKRCCGLLCTTVHTAVHRCVHRGVQSGVCVHRCHFYCCWQALLVACSKLVGVGKLGHGDTGRVYKPKVIEALTGTHIRKVVCSGQSSIALTSTGQV